MRHALALCLVACSTALAAPAQACGGFFCSSSPVDQSAEKIVFAVDEAKGTTDMIVQIAYQGDDESFAWLLPVGAVPTNREVFPALALNALDAQSAIQWQLPESCESYYDSDNSTSKDAGARAASKAEGADAGVIVHVMETVDVYDVAVIESESAEASFAWLTANGYRLSAVMKPYLELYTAMQMKFLALKLTADASVKDLKPFKMTLPGTTPTIPLRLTAIAAEPEMGVLVWILGGRRFEPANAEEIDIPEDALRWVPNTYPPYTNWSSLVARYVDARGGRGWVVENAGATDVLRNGAFNSPAGTDAQQSARTALLKLLEHPYMTRLYTRVASEEMSYDPTFRQSSKPDVAQLHELPERDEQCVKQTYDVCDFATCGTLGLCRHVEQGDKLADLAGCACAPGSSARASRDPRGQPVVICQDQRMSFMNPGEADETGEKFADPCVGVSCGGHGSCVAMNLTPTCVCDEGYVAIAPSAATRTVECALPTTAIPKGFYNRRPPPLAPGMVAGRTLPLAAAAGPSDVELPPMYGAPSSAPTLEPEVKTKSGGCALATGTHGLWLALGLLLWRRRR